MDRLPSFRRFAEREHGVAVTVTGGVVRVCGIDFDLRRNALTWSLRLAGRRIGRFRLRRDALNAAIAAALDATGRDGTGTLSLWQLLSTSSTNERPPDVVPLEDSTNNANRV